MGLLKFYFSTSFFKSLLESFCSSLIYTFLNSGGSSVYDVLSFLKTKATVFLDCLNDLKLSGTSTLEDYIERRLFFFLSTFSGTSYDYSCSCRFDSVLILEDSCEFAYFLYRQVYQLFGNCFDICHVDSLFLVLVLVFEIVMPLIQRQLQSPPCSPCSQELRQYCG